jgi:hypothetical protein
VLVDSEGKTMGVVKDSKLAVISGKAQSPKPKAESPKPKAESPKPDSVRVLRCCRLRRAS